MAYTVECRRTSPYNYTLLCQSGKGKGGAERGCACGVVMTGYAFSEPRLPCLVTAHFSILQLKGNILTTLDDFSNIKGSHSRRRAIMHRR